MLIQDQRHDGNLSPAERMKRQQRVIDSSQAGLSDHDGWQLHLID
jgi:hypothetical protein